MAPIKHITKPSVKTKQSLAVCFRRNNRIQNRRSTALHNFPLRPLRYSESKGLYLRTIQTICNACKYIAHNLLSMKTLHREKLQNKTDYEEIRQNLIER